MRKFFLYWFPVYSYMALIFYLSSLSRPPEQFSLFEWDKLNHCLEYAILGLLLIRALNEHYGKVGFLQLQIIAFIIAAVYGASDEFHQSFIFGRSASFLDWITDMIGAAIGAFFILKRKKASWQK
ncbi:MAG: hypothetical protein A2Y00_08435 [Omnitrophica WOR_2 bacterium GWF2_43_52]|nr:MAG: hypothetical protein A2062_03890 [Omnitrophica WOR_2 bacterium GWA2_44_7]OGX16937.1 MAG: hypothetical protein A2Y01_06415 [Omnitrophica WOR_2 bacterium GWC2_44_8]OGX21126.1 MAG: hypothetical protein A2Y00_08435 [Omnitrophica WOR_2 bacterium GWF2_43_52]OGX55137.1 MAG: hypothetical protein A2460_09985 [Omnitrophica WOR_2 bacterium RIFOXYC2_FULL_43_9]HAH19936.1 VanZ family protein [Candidatus Omnitrophota bacterium]